MSLRKKALVACGSTLLGLLAICYLVGEHILLADYVRLEVNATERSVQRGVHVLANELKDLDRQVLDWANWDDTYAFMQDRNAAYVASNLADQASVDLHVDFILYVDSAGDLVFGKAVDPVGDCDQPLSDTFQSTVPRQCASLQPSASEVGAGGLLIIAGQPALVAARPILTSARTGPARGTLVFGRYLTEAEMGRLSDLAQLTLAICPVKTIGQQPDFATVWPRLAAGAAAVVQPQDAHVITAYALLRDAFKEPALVLRVTKSRDIYAEGQRATHYLAVALCVVGIVFGALGMLLIERLVLAPVARLSADVDRIGTRRDFSARVAEAGDDELGRLGQSINVMLGALQETMVRLRDSGELLQCITASAKDAIVMTDHADRVLFWNAAATTVFGYAAHEAHGRNVRDLVVPERAHAEFAANMQQFRGERARSGRGQTLEIIVRRRDGVEIPVEVGLSGVQRDGGLAVVAVIRDTTERTRAERNLQRANLAIEESGTVVFIWKMEPMWAVEQVSQNVSCYGYTATELLAGDPPYEALIHPDDRERVAEQVRDYVAGSEGNFTLECRLVRRDGEERTVEHRMHVVRQDDGQIESLQGVLIDVTERKRAERALFESHERFLSVLDGLDAIVYVSDLRTHDVLFANRRACDTFGRDITGMKCWQATRLDSTRPCASCTNKDLVGHRGLPTAGCRREYYNELVGMWLDVRDRAIAWPDGRLVKLEIAYDITDRKKAEEALREGEARLKTIVAAIPAGILIVDRATHTIVDANPAALEMFGAPREAVLGAVCHRFVCPAEAGRCPVSDRGEAVNNSERVLLTADGRRVPILKTVVPISLRGQDCLLEAFVDITEHKRAEEELLAHRERLEELVAERTQKLVQSEWQILQGEKLASVGRLAAGVAHEINTPIQYVGDNLRALQDFFTDITTLLDQYRGLVELVAQGAAEPKTAAGIRAAEQERDLAFILEDAPKAITQGLEGVGRVASIVRAMKDFSHVGGSNAANVDINRCVQSTLTVARNEYKYHADIETHFGDLPEVECFASELNQVFLNLLVNAAHAIQDTGRRGQITVTTQAVSDGVEIAIADTGTGIPEDIRHKIYEPFFTTKEVGRGTGQGLAIAHQIVVGKHRGELLCESTVGAGTTFRIRIPLRIAERDATGKKTGDA